jgi:hypothetical protein
MNLTDKYMKKVGYTISPPYKFIIVDEEVPKNCFAYSYRKKVIVGFPGTFAGFNFPSKLYKDIQPSIITHYRGMNQGIVYPNMSIKNKPANWDEYVELFKRCKENPYRELKF